MGVVQKYNLQTSEDRSLNPCNIQGLCTLPNGTFVAADSNNFRLKLLDAKCSVSSHVDCTSWPYGVCYMDDNQLAVTMGGTAIQFVDSKSGELELIRNIKLDHECYDIAYQKRNGQMFVTSGVALYVYSKEGELIKKLYEDKSGKLTVNKVAVADDGKQIYITNFGKHRLVTLDEEGNALATFSDPELLGPTGVCVGDNGTIFVCGEESRAVLQLDQDATTKMATVASSLHGVFKPQSLVFHKGLSKLIVGQDHKFCVLELSLN